MTVISSQARHTRRDERSPAEENPGAVQVQGRQNADGGRHGILRQLAPTLPDLADGEILRSGENHRKSPIHSRNLHAASAMAWRVQLLRESGFVCLFQ